MVDIENLKFRISGWNGRISGSTFPRAASRRPPASPVALIFPQNSQIFADARSRHHPVFAEIAPFAKICAAPRRPPACHFGD